MNVIKGILREVDGRSWVEAQGHSWPTATLAQAVDGQTVAYGVRPTDITVSTTGNGIPAKVIVVEPTGAETELLLEVGSSRVVVVLHGRTDARPDEIIHLEIAPGKAHLFDDVTGIRLE